MKSKSAISQLKSVWGKIGLDEIPSPDETRDTLKTADPGRRKSGRTAQLNLRIRPQEKERIALLAVREQVSINEIFSRMLALYEREHGRVELAGKNREPAEK